MTIDRLPITATQHQLPFNQLSWEQFERLCFRLLEARGYKEIEHLGESGGEQGRDFLAWSGRVRVAAQCKRVQRFTAAHGKNEIDKILTLRGKSRPQLLIFIITCRISSSARDAIRQAWRGYGRSCEFFSISELDAAVRANSAILDEFFFSPHAHSTYGIASNEPFDKREATGELLRVETMNREWMASTRSLHFGRLLQTLEEIEPLDNRLEAARAFHLAVRRNGAKSTVTERNALQICTELDFHGLFQLNWKLHRMLARVVGDV